MAPRRIPLNLFGMGFGLAGLAGCWRAVGQAGDAPTGVGETLLGLSAAVWLLVLVLYLRYVFSVRGAFSADLQDPVAGPFSSLAVITPLLLAAQGLTPYSPNVARVLVDVLIILSLLLGGWLTGQWIYRPFKLDQLHPGHFLPTVAGGLVASVAAALVGQQRLAELLLGLGLVCWFVLGSTILFRLFFRPLLQPALLPTLAIEVAPAAVASLAYFAIDDGEIDAFAAAVAGYGLLMVVVQLRLLPAYLRLRFGPSTWAFTFSWAAVGTAVLHWIEVGEPAGHTAYTYLVAAGVTALVGGIAVRTVIAVIRGNFLPGPGPKTPQTPTRKSVEAASTQL